jgi:hypothetical protein
VFLESVCLSGYTCNEDLVSAEFCDWAALALGNGRHTQQRAYVVLISRICT